MASRVISLTDRIGGGSAVDVLREVADEIESSKSHVRVIVTIIEQDGNMDLVSARVAGGIKFSECVGYLDLTKDQLKYAE